MPVGGPSNDELDEVDLWFEAAIADVKLAQAREEEAGRLMTLAAVGRHNRLTKLRPDNGDVTDQG